MRNKFCWMLLFLLLAAVAHADVAAWEAQMKAAQQAATLGFSMVEGDWGAAVRHYKAAVKEAEQFPAPDPRLADSLYALGLCYMHPDIEKEEDELDRESYLHRADLLFARAAAICTKAYGKRDPRMAKTECMLGHLATHHSDDDNTVAEQHYRAALALAKKLRPQDVAMTVEVYDLACDFFQGNKPMVESLMRQALAAAEAAYGKDDPRLADRLYHLAAVLDDKAAEELYRRALHNAEQAYGADDPRTEEARGTLALFLAGQKRLPEARACLTRMLANAEKAYGPDDPHLLPTLYRLVDIMPALEIKTGNRMGIAGESAPHFNPELETDLLRATRIAAKSGDGPAQVEAWTHLAAYYRSRQMMEQAWRPLENALAAAEQAYGKDDARILPSLYALAYWACDEDPVQFELLFQRAIAIVDKAYGNTPQAVDDLEQIAIAYARAERQEAARALQQRIADIRMNDPQADPDDLLPILKRMVAENPAKKDGPEPTPEQARLLAFITKVHGPASLEMVAQLQLFQSDMIMLNVPQPKRKVYFLHRLAAIVPKAYAGDRSKLIWALDSLGDDEAKAGLTQEAIATDSQALSLLAQMPKPDPFFRYHLSRALGNLYWETKVLDKAEIYLSRSAVLAEKADRNRPEDALKELARFYRATGKVAKADAVYEQIYQLLAKKEGAVTEDTVRALIARARLNREIGQPAKAVPMLQRALAATEKDPKQPHVGEWSGNLLGTILKEQYLTYRRLGQQANADACLTRLFVMAKGPGREKADQGVGNILDIADQHHASHQDALAAGLLERLLAVEENRYGKDSPQLGMFLPRLGDVYLALHNTAKADACYARLLAIIEKSDTGTGPRQRMIGDELDPVADYYKTRHRDGLLEGLWRRRLVRDQARYSDQITAYSQTILNLCEALMAQKKYTEADALLQPLLAALQTEAKRHHQPIPPDVDLTAGKLYAAWEKPEQALSYLRDAYTQADASYTSSYQLPYLLPYAEAYAAVLHTLHQDADAKPLDARIKELRSLPKEPARQRDDWFDL